MFLLTSWIKHHNESDLLHRIAAPNADAAAAFAELYQATNAQLFTAVMTYTKDEHATQDILQQVYIKCWEKRATLTNLSSLANWLFIVARNAALDHLKKKAREQTFLKIASASNSAAHSGYPNFAASPDSLDSRETRKILEKAMAQLPPQQRRAYQLAFEEELSQEEIATHMEISTFTVKRHLELARRFVRSYVSQNLTTIFFLAALGAAAAGVVFRG